MPRAFGRTTLTVVAVAVLVIVFQYEQRLAKLAREVELLRTQARMSDLGRSCLLPTRRSAAVPRRHIRGRERYYVFWQRSSSHGSSRSGRGAKFTATSG